MEIVLQFSPDGRGLCLHTELLPLADIGRLEVQRASMVEFNQRVQKWEVTLTGHQSPCFSATSRARCLDWERSELQQGLLSQ